LREGLDAAQRFLKQTRHIPMVARSWTDTLHAVDFQDLVAIVIDHLDRDFAGLWFRERAA
jgi:hypothetical protein